MSDSNKELKEFLKTLSYEDLAKICKTLAEVEKDKEKEDNTEVNSKAEVFDFAGPKNKRLEALMDKFTKLAKPVIKSAEIINKTSDELEANVYIGVIVRDYSNKSDDTNLASTYVCGNLKTLGKYFAQDSFFKEVIEEM